MVDAAPLKGPVTLIGARGMLARALAHLLAARSLHFTPADLPEHDITSPDSVRRLLSSPGGVILNCAAYTDVDGAEADPAAAHRVNAHAVEILAARAREIDATLVHFSTDYVFDGAGRAPYPTDHPRAPLNEYGRSKAAGEEALERSGARFLIIRTSWLYAPWAKNFVRTIAKAAAARPELRVVSDQRGRPTSAENLARQTLALIDRGATGIYHATDAGECTWHQFAAAIVSGLNLPARVEPCTTAEFPRPARRPAYSVLDISATDELIGPAPHWNDCLASVLSRLEQPL
ncbi:MAG: dTDP-4-dehydrorhamnose reductase [Planctomycetota bacterium]|nr:dTDP-4-dehydrorhamnose reductase [Planctomycetota bacterium]